MAYHFSLNVVHLILENSNEVEHFLNTHLYIEGFTCGKVSQVVFITQLIGIRVRFEPKCSEDHVPKHYAAHYLSS